MRCSVCILSLIHISFLTAGKGDMLVWASRDGKFGYAKLSFGKEDALKLSLDKKEGESYTLPIDVYKRQLFNFKSNSILSNYGSAA